MFMQKQITDPQEWIAIDGNCGTTYVPVDVDPGLASDIKRMSTVQDEQAIHRMCDDRAAQYYEGTKIDSLDVVHGIGARMSAPGYMDCTDWSIFDNATEAHEYLDEYYGEDEE
jgi:hypothetical protein